MGRSTVSLGLFVSLCLLLCVQTASAAITRSGSVAPTSDPSTWTGSTSVFIGSGNNSTGSLKIDGTSYLTTGNTHIGYASGAAGALSIEGSAANWDNIGDLLVGSYFSSGKGILNINGGAMPAIAGTTYVGSYSTAAGTISFGTGGGTLSTGGLYAVASQFLGTGTIETCGFVGDSDLVFNSRTDLFKTLTFNTPGNGQVVVNLNLTSGAGKNFNLGVGWKTGGLLSIRNGVTIDSRAGIVGYASGAAGTATVAGAGSTWNCTSTLNIGYAGRGSLDISDGGTVKSGGGDIANTDSSVTVRGARSTWDTSGSSLHVEGRLNIIDGGAVTSGYASIYPISGTIGTTVSGLGSSWTTSGLMIGGYSGASCGVLNVVNGGKVVNSSFADIGGDLGVEGFVRVNGAGSSWNNTAAEGLSVGLWSGRGTMTVTGGGTVTASTASIGSTSLVSIDVSHGSTLNLGSGVGALTNDGIIRVCADANAPTGDYTPILAAAAWSGAGSCQPLGGVWNATSHVLSVFESMTGAAGNPVTIDDLRYAQRILVSDSGPGRTGWTVGAGFAPTTDMKSLSLTATVMDASLTQGLANKLALGQVLCSAWDFSASGYTSGDPVYLSFGIGAGRKWSDLHVWHRDASGWTEFLPNDLNYDGTYASFTASGFSGYAISVPEPGSLSLLGAICLILLAYRTRRRGVLG